MKSSFVMFDLLFSPSRFPLTLNETGEFWAAGGTLSKEAGLRRFDVLLQLIWTTSHLGFVVLEQPFGSGASGVVCDVEDDDALDLPANE